MTTFQAHAQFDHVRIEATARIAFKREDSKSLL